LTKYGQIFVITAPSGAGKTTIINSIRKDMQDIGYSVSHTTRSPRKGEINGYHYHFVNVDEFKKMITSNEFIEWAVVYEQFYGSSISSMNSVLSSGKDLLMDLDIQGAKEVKSRFPDCSLIFILPPSIKVLEQRLKNRTNNNETNIAVRMKKALGEIKECSHYDFIIVNNELEKAIRELQAVIISQRTRKERRLTLVKDLFNLKENDSDIVPIQRD